MEPQDILELLKGVFEEKNEDYGNSWEKVGVLKRVMADERGPTVVYLNTDGTWTVDEPKHDCAVEAVQLSDTPTNNTTFEQNVDDLVTRLLDMLVRAYNLTLMKDEPQLDNESTLDAWEDLTGYAAMGSSLVASADEEHDG